MWSARFTYLKNLNMSGKRFLDGKVQSNKNTNKNTMEKNGYSSVNLSPLWIYGCEWRENQTYLTILKCSVLQKGLSRIQPYIVVYFASTTNTPCRVYLSADGRVCWPVMSLCFVCSAAWEGHAGQRQRRADRGQVPGPFHRGRVGQHHLCVVRRYSTWVSCFYAVRITKLKHQCLY